VIAVCAAAGCSSRRGPANQPASAQSQPAQAAVSRQAAADLAGYSSTQSLESKATPLTVPDILFYLQVMRAALARTEHPAGQDQAALVYFHKWSVEGNEASQKAVAAIRSGNYAAAAGIKAPTRTPAVGLAQNLIAGRADILEAASRGMPDRQWSALRDAVERAGAKPCARPLPSLSSPTLAQDWEAYGEECYGGSGDNPLPGLTAAQLRQAARQDAIYIQTILADRKTIAPYAAQIRTLENQLAQAKNALQRQYASPNP